MTTQLESPAIGTPALQIPYELTSQIFLHCLPPHGRIHPSPTTAPLLLAQICRYWRDIALSNPQLWSSIFLEFHPGSRSDIITMRGVDGTPAIHPTTALVDLWFSRTQGCPLYITFRSLSKGHQLPDGLISVLTGRSTQWGQLKLNLSLLDSMELHEAIGPFPLLQSLAIDINDATAANFTRNNNLYVQAPRLTALRLGSAFSGTFPVPKDVACVAQLLTILEFWAPELAWAAAVFDLFPYLRRLTLHINFPPSPMPAGSSVPVTAHLTCLILGGNKDNVGFLQYITIPTLEHLGASICDEESATTILSFVTRSRCVLTRLSLREQSNLYYHILHTLSPLLSTTQSLLTLELASGIVASKRLLSDDRLLPHLHTLCITVMQTDDVYYTFLKILRSRRTALRRAELRLRSSYRAEDFPPLYGDLISAFESLVAAGMRITLRTPTSTWPEESCEDFESSSFDQGESLWVDDF